MMSHARTLYPSASRILVSDPTSGDLVCRLQHEKKTEIIEALHAVLSGVSEPEAVLTAILRVAVTRTGADRGILVEVRWDGPLAYRFMSCFQARHFEGDAGAFSRTLFARVVQSGEGVLLQNAADDSFYSESASIQALRTAAILCEP